MYPRRQAIRLRGESNGATMNASSDMPNRVPCLVVTPMTR